MSNNYLEKDLEELPDIVAHAKAEWQRATLYREMTEAKSYRIHKTENSDRTATEIKALIHLDLERKRAVDKEIDAEEFYNAKYETLMCKKALAKLRTAF